MNECGEVEDRERRPCPGYDEGPQGGPDAVADEDEAYDEGEVAGSSACNVSISTITTSCTHLVLRSVQSAMYALSVLPTVFTPPTMPAIIGATRRDQYPPGMNLENVQTSKIPRASIICPVMAIAIMRVRPRRSDICMHAGLIQSLESSAAEMQTYRAPPSSRQAPEDTRGNTHSGRQLCYGGLYVRIGRAELPPIRVAR